jgi:dolichol-phosphate mannosyltransferase
MARAQSRDAELCRRPLEACVDPLGIQSTPVSEDSHSAQSNPAIWVCIPTFDEAGNVEPMVERLLAVFDDSGLDAGILIIDDASPDGTGRIADRLSERDARVHVLHRAAKDGLGSAYRDGFRFVLAHGAQRIVEMDCDFSHDPDDVPRLVAAADQADLVLGSRYVEGGSIENWGPIRRLISRGGSSYARWVLGITPRDLTGGFKCFRRSVLEAVPFDEVAAAGYVFQIEMTYRAILLGFDVVEVPITFRDREVGTSKMSHRIVWEAAAHVPRLRGRLGRQRNR